MRFEPNYYEGEPNERSPHWEVIEWTQDDGQGHRSGHTVQRCFNQLEAQMLAEMLNYRHTHGEHA